MGLTRWPVVAPSRLRSHERSISFWWKVHTFSIATQKLSMSSGERDPRALSIPLLGTRISCGLTPSKRSVYSRRASSPLSRTSATIRRAASRTFSSRKPPGRRSWGTNSLGPASRASTTLTNRDPGFHSSYEASNLLVAKAVGTAVGDQARGGGGDLVENHEVILAQGSSGGRQIQNALSEAHERGELYGSVKCDDLRLTAYPLEVSPCRVGELGRYVHNLGVGDRSPYFGSLLSGGCQDHTASPCTEISQLHNVRPLLLQNVLADDADVRCPILYEDRHVGRTAHDELCSFSLVEELAIVLPQNLYRQPGPPKRPQSVLEDVTFRHRHTQVLPHAHRAASPSTFPATSSMRTASKRVPGSAEA